MIREEGKVGIEENFPKYSEEIGKIMYGETRYTQLVERGQRI